MNSITKALSKLTQLGLNMVVSIGICFFIGQWIDQKLNTGNIFLVIFIILGIGAGFRNMYIMIMKDYKKEEEKERKRREEDYKNINK